MTLYELTGEYLNLMQIAEEENLDADVLADTMDAIEGEIEEKADGYAKVIQSLKGDAAAIKSEIERLTAKKQALENNIKSIKDHLEQSMLAMDKPKIKTALFNFSIQKNPPAVVIDDELGIPAEYWIEQEPKLDKTGIKTYLKEHDADWAHLVQTEGLRIR